MRTPRYVRSVPPGFFHVFHAPWLSAPYAADLLIRQGGICWHDSD
jgi:hypothetical protein